MIFGGQAYLAYLVSKSQDIFATVRFVAKDCQKGSEVGMTKLYRYRCDNCGYYEFWDEHNWSDNEQHLCVQCTNNLIELY